MATDFDGLAEAIEDAFGTVVLTVDLHVGRESLNVATGEVVQPRRTVVVPASASARKVLLQDGASGARERVVLRTYTVRTATWLAAAAKAAVPEGRMLGAGDAVREGKATDTYRPPAALVTKCELPGDAAMMVIDTVCNEKI